LGVTPPIGGIGSWLVSIPATIQEWLRPLARSSSNAKIFSPHSDPQLISFENSLSDNNRMYVMRVIGSDCSDIVRWSQWLDEGREGIGNDGIIFALIAGEDDGMFSVEDCRQLFNSISQNSNMFHVIKGTGHLSMMEKSESINAIIRDVIYSD
jgi:pimeloyl-ACP methyl ester carboxylesterase